MPNPLALLRYMVAISEIARLINSYNTLFLHHNAGKLARHHEHTAFAHVTFGSEIAVLVQVLGNMGIPLRIRFVVWF